MAQARSVIDVMLGEAAQGTREQRYEDMKAIASAMVNRARATGMPLEDVVSVPSQFNAYGKALPGGVDAYRDLAEQALTDVLNNGPVHNATFYATPAAKDNLPSGLNEVARTSGHVYFEDPQGRAIKTTQGYASPIAAAYDATPTPRPNTSANAFDSILADAPENQSAGLLSNVSAPSFPATPSPVQRGGLLSDVAPAQAATQTAFDTSRFGEPAAPQASSFDTGRFGEPSYFDLSRVTEPDVPAAAPSAPASFDTQRFGAPAAPSTLDPSKNGMRRGLLDQQLNAGLLPSLDNPAYAAMRAPTSPLAYTDPMVTTSAPAPAATVNAPAVTRAATGLPQPPAVANGLMSPEEYEHVQQQQGLLGGSGRVRSEPGLAASVESSLKSRGLTGGILGGLAGGALLGPLGAVLGGLLGKHYGRTTYFPPAPQAPLLSPQQQALTRGGGNGGFGALNSYGQGAYHDSGQFQSAVDSGTSGLW